MTTDKNIEAFVLNGEVKIIRDGQIMDLTDSIYALEVFANDMAKDHFIVRALEAKGITDPVQQIKAYISCRYGDFDTRADITPDGVTIPEYWDCGQRGNCPHEGTLCLLPSGPNGTLTSREIEVIKLIVRDMPDKQIADILKICENTVHKHRQNIEHKLDVATKVGVATFAIHHNII